jgi:hypothetical protein
MVSPITSSARVACPSKSQLVKAPLLARMLTILSLTGLNNLLTGEVYMMQTSGTWEFVLNTAEGELPEFVALDESGLWEPGGVLGYIWHDNQYIADQLGYAVEGTARSYDSLNQTFDHGQMYYSIDGFIYVLYDTTWWELYPDAGPLTESGD